jgi:transcription elongation factor Elf1
MSNFILTTIEYASENYDSIVSLIIEILLAAYLAYGILLAVDGYKRYGNLLAAIIVFLLWLLFSILFLPIYLIVRPSLTYEQRQSEAAQQQALVMANNLTQCNGCDEIIKNSAKFCHYCGHKNQVRCTSCNKDNYHDSLFCHHCGKQLPKYKTEKRNFIDRSLDFLDKLLERKEVTITEKPKSKPQKKKKKQKTNDNRNMALMKIDNDSVDKLKTAQVVNG